MALLFDSAKKYSLHTIEDGGLAIQSTLVGSGVSGYTFLTDAVAGKQYYEFVVNELGPLVVIGGGDGTDNVATLAAGFEWESDGSWVINGAGQGGGAGGIAATYTTGDVVMFAVDVTGGKVYLGKNGSWIGSHDPAAGTGGHSVTFGGTRYMGASVVSNSSGTLRKVTGQFTAASQTYSAPSGFSPADPGGGGGTAHDGASTLTGAGSLVLAAHIARSGAAALGGTGSLAAAATLTKGGAAALSGSGSITAAAGRSLVALASLNGTGSLASAAQRALRASTALDGIGTLAASGSRSLYGAASLSGAGTLAANGSLGGTLSAAALLAGTGALTVSAQVRRGAAASLTGTGAFSAALSAVMAGAATLTGAGGLSAMARLEAQVSAALAGAGSLTAVGRNEALRVATVSRTVTQIMGTRPVYSQRTRPRAVSTGSR